MDDQANVSPTEKNDGVSARVASFVLDAGVDAFPPSALDAAATALLDTLGVAIGAASLDAARIGRETARLFFAAGAEDCSARLLFDGRRASLAGAAYAAATQIDNLDAHDGYNPTKGHIGVAAAPALAALAETEPTLTGPEALATLTIGYEIAGRAGLALHATVSDYHTSGAWNALGVAAMAARRRRLGATALRHALGVAEYHGPRSQMMREIANPTMLHDGSGWGALVGLSAAALAERGFEGAPAITVEDPAVADCWTDLGAFWQIERQYVKPYPICRWAHAAIDAASELRDAHGFHPDDIASVRIETFREAAQLFRGMPDTTSKAQYSLAFAVASMIEHGRIGVAEITGEGLRDARVARLVDRISVVESDRHSARFPMARWSDATVTLTDGRVLGSGDVHARGGPERPFERADVVEKFMGLSEPVVGAARASAIVERTFDLTSPTSRFADLAAHLYDQPSP